MTQEIVFDIGGTNSRIALFKAGKIVWRDQVKTSGQMGPEAMLNSMLNMLGSLELCLPQTSALGSTLSSIKIGVAIAGLVKQGEVYASNAEILKGWDYFPLEAMLTEKLQHQVMVRNDARAAAWGEYLYGSGKCIDNFLFITVSTGVGAGLVLQRQLHLARNGFDAELGETLTNDHRNLEFHASGSGLERLAIAHGFGNAKTLCDAADRGDIEAENLYRHGIHELAKKIADLVVMLGIEKVALGGGLGLRAGYLERLQTELASLSAICPMYQVPIVSAELGHDAGLIGMAALLRTGNHG